VFEFFWFDGSTKPFSFYRGCDSKDPPARRRVFRLPEETVDPRPFIHALRLICEIIFDLLLRGYISSLKACHHRSVRKSAKEGQPRKSLDKWEQAISSAVEASEKFRNAETKRQIQLTDEANAIVQEAMESFKCRYGSPMSSCITSNHLSCNIA
jgi:hypothetical protein